MKRLLARILLIALTANFTACAGQQVPIHTAADTMRTNSQDEYRYSYAVTFKSGEKFYLDDEDVQVRNNLIGIRFEGREDYRFYSPNQFQEIRAKKKRYTWTGAGIGAGAGAALGVGMSFIAYPPTKDCDRAGDPGDCRMLKVVFPLGFGFLGAAAGFGIGAAIGYQIPKKKKQNTVVMTPNIYGNDEMNITGGGLAIGGKF